MTKKSASRIRRDAGQNRAPLKEAAPIVGWSPERQAELGDLLLQVSTAQQLIAGAMGALVVHHDLANITAVKATALRFLTLVETAERFIAEGGVFPSPAAMKAALAAIQTAPAQPKGE